MHHRILIPIAALALAPFAAADESEVPPPESVAAARKVTAHADRAKTTAEETLQSCDRDLVQARDSLDDLEEKLAKSRQRESDAREALLKAEGAVLARAADIAAHDQSLTGKSDSEKAAAKAPREELVRRSDAANATRALRAAELARKSAELVSATAATAAAREIVALREQAKAKAEVESKNAATALEAAKTAEKEAKHFYPVTRGHLVRITTGVHLASPYTYQKATHTLNSDGSDATPYMELFMTNRHAWCAATGKGRDWWSLDLDFRLTLNPAHADDDTSALLGSGDFGMELGAALPFCIHPATVDEPRISTLGPVVSWSGVTSRKDFDIHKRFLFGVDYSLRYADDPQGLSNGSCFNLRAGPALIDAVRFTDRDKREIAFEGAGADTRPAYHLRPAFAIEMEYYKPLLPGGSGLVFGTRFYTGVNPNTWNAYAAVTIPLDSLFRGLGGKSENNISR